MKERYELGAQLALGVLASALLAALVAHHLLRPEPLARHIEPSRTPSPRSEPVELSPGTRVVVSVSSLEGLHQRKSLFHQKFAERHSPFWTPSQHQISACEIALSESPSADRLLHPLESYDLQFAGVARHSSQQILVHGFCPRGPKTLSFSMFGAGGLVFAPFHTGRCYFEAYCRPSGDPPTFHFGSAPR